MFDQLQVWFDGSTSRIASEQFQRGVRDTRLSFEVDGQGLTPGQYSLTVHMVYETRFLETVNFTERIEIKDMSQPAVIDGAILPTAILNTERVFVLLGISNARKVLQIRESLSFKVRHGNEEEQGEVVGSAVKLLPDQTDATNYLTLIEKTGSTGLLSDKLVVQYHRVVRSAKSAAEPGEEIGLLLVRTPAMPVNGTVRGIVSGGEVSAEFDLYFV